MPRTSKPLKRKKIEAAPEEDDDIETQLEEIYQDSDGTIPDMKHIEHRKSGPGMMITFLLLLFLAAAAGAAWLGFFIFNPTQKFSEEQVSVTVTIPEKIVAGIEESYEVRVKNSNKLALATSDVEIKLPAGFIVISATPKGTTPKNDAWILGAIDSSASKTIAFKAVYAGQKNTTDTLRALLTYRPENFNAEFQKVINKELVIAAEATEISLTKKTVDDKEEVSVKYKNIADEALKDVRVVVQLGTNFTVAKTTPAGQKIQSGAVSFAINKLGIGQEGTVVVHGSYATSTSANTEPSARIERDLAGHTIVLSDTSLSVIAPTTGGDQKPVDAQQAVAPGSVAAMIRRTDDSTNQQVKMGDTVVLRATVTNTTDKPLKISSLVLTADTPAIKNKGIFDFTKLQTTGDPDVIGRQSPGDRRLATITWKDANLPPAAAELQPGKSLSVDITITRKLATELNLDPKQMIAAFGFSATTENSAVLNAKLISVPLATDVVDDTATKTTSTKAQ